MNIVYLCGNPGLDLERMLGPKIHVQAILRGLKAKGINATLLAVQKTNTIKGYDEFETVILSHRYLRGFVHRVIPYTGLVNSFRVFCQIIRLNRTKHFALIHERYTGLSWGGVWAAKILRIPHILQMVGPGIEEKALQLNPLKPSKRWIALVNQKYLLANCHHLILVSKLIASFIYRHRGWRLPNYTVILNGADFPSPLSSDEKTAVRQQYGIEKQPLFIYSGSLYRWYGTLELVKAFHLALQQRPDLKLIIVGAGDAETAIRRYIIKNDLAGSITMIGVIPQTELHRLIQIADFCLVYYLGEPTYHGSSTKTMEYLAAGKPIVSTPHMLEVIEDGFTGFMSKTSSPEDFAAKIIAAVNQPDLARRISENAKNLSKNYTWNHYIMKLLKIYSNCLKPNPCPARTNQ